MWLTYRGGDFAGRKVEVTGSSFVIGRDEGCDLTLDDERASRQHARITVQADGTTVIEDLGSSNGTTVNGRRISEPTTLSGGEAIQIGSTVLVSTGHEPSGAATTLGEVPAAAGVPGGASPSVIQRITANTKRTKIAVGLGAAALAVMVVVAVLVVVVIVGGDDEPPSTAEIVDELRPSTALILRLEDGEPIGNGSGWVLDAEEGLIVTNAHVIDGGNSHTATFDGGEPRETELVGTAPCEDLAVLRVSDTEGLRSLPLAESQDDVTEGDRVVLVGFPGSSSLTRRPLTATEGIVSIARTVFDAPSLTVPALPNIIQTDAADNPGNSGGPLVNEDGELVGVLSAGRDDRQNQGFAVGVDRVREIVPRLAGGESIGWTGLSLLQYIPDAEAAAADLQEAGLPVLPGILVGVPYPGTGADEAGFGRSRGYLVAVNGMPLDDSKGLIPGSLQGYCDAIGNGEEGDSVELSVFAPGDAEPQSITIDFE